MIIRVQYCTCSYSNNPWLRQRTDKEGTLRFLDFRRQLLQRGYCSYKYCSVAIFQLVVTKAMKKNARRENRPACLRISTNLWLVLIVFKTKRSSSQLHNSSCIEQSQSTQTGAAVGTYSPKGNYYEGWLYTFKYNSFFLSSRRVLTNIRYTMGTLLSLRGDLSTQSPSHYNRSAPLLFSSAIFRGISCRIDPSCLW